jgi:beta-galactosidase
MMDMMEWVLCLSLVATVLSTTLASASAREVRSLDGPWEIAFDHGNEGRAAEWHAETVFSKLEGRREIAVPSCWEEIEQDYEGVAFYGRRFAVPKKWEGKIVRLQFDAVNYIAEVYVNDHVAGRHEGGYGPFELRVDDLLEFGSENFVSLRVIGPIVAQKKVIDGVGQSDMPHWRGAIAGGIWQSVRLVATGKVFVDDIFVVPHVKDMTADIRVVLQNAGHEARDVTAVVMVRGSDGDMVADETTGLRLVPGTSERTWSLSLPNAGRWSPDQPHLCAVTVRITEDNDVQDEERVRFGMRELTIRNKRFELNGKPIYIKAAFFEGLYPTRLANPDSKEMALREIQLARECGFNMIRPWRKPPPPMWLDLCDELGMMVIGGLPIECMKRWPTATPGVHERIENEVRSAVMRDRNRACIVQWEIFNEVHRKELEVLKHPMSMLARRLDTSRLILDESGGFAGGSNIYLPGKYEPEVFNDVHSYPGAPLNDVSYDRFLALSRTPAELRAMGMEPARVRSRTTPGRLTVVSEIGYGSLPDLVDNNKRFAESGNPLVPPYRYHKDMAEWITRALKDSGLDAVYPDLQKFCLDQQAIHSQGNKRMLEAIRSNPRIGGYCVHALTGGDWVLGAGLLDLFRNPKGSYQGTKEASQPRCLALRVRPRNVYAAQGATIDVTGINELDEVAGRLVLEIVGADGTSVLKSESRVTLLQGIASLHSDRLDAAQLSGAYEARVRLVNDDGAVVAENSVSFDVYGESDLVPPDAKIALLDTGDALRSFLNGRGMAFVEFGADTPQSLPVFVAKAHAANPAQKEQFRMLQEFVRKGGTVVYLDTVQRKPASFWGRWLPAKDVLPVQAKVENAFGLWVGVSHIVTDHRVFDGLPSKCMMGQAYENVFSPHTLIGTGGELIVGSISHGWYQLEEDKQNYLGPSPAWYGMDMGVVTHGEGRYVLSALRIVENLGKDPVADKILFNLVGWLGNRSD